MTIIKPYEQRRWIVVLVAALGSAACPGSSGDSGDSGGATGEASGSTENGSGSNDTSSGEGSGSSEASAGEAGSSGDGGGPSGPAACWSAASEEECEALADVGLENLPDRWFCFWTEVRRHAALVCGEPASTESMCFGVRMTGSQGCYSAGLCATELPDAPPVPVRHIREVDGGWESFDYDYCHLSNRLVDRDGNDWLGWAHCYWNGPDPEDLEGESPELCACECPPP